MQVIKENQINIVELAAALKSGAILALPTDTVYGLVCDASNKKSVEKVFKIKKRAKSKTLPVFVKDIAMAKEYAIVDKLQEDFLNKNWPGAMTVVLAAKKGLAPLVYKKKTIALRQPDYKLIDDIMEQLGRPLAQTSANISGQGATTKLSDVVSQLKDEDILVVDAGDLQKHEPSIIIDLTSDKIKVLRP